MKIPYGWVRECCDLDLTAAQAADRLINAGVEVASVTPIAPPDLRGVVVGKIEAIERELGESHGHRLVVCRVSTGAERFSVVCGAPNVAVGARAAFAPPGATLPGGRRVATTTIRHVESQGMLCSERELGLGDEHESGLLLLDGSAAPGADLVAVLGLDDEVLEVEITPNRPDCLSVFGIARELAALTGAPLRPPAVSVKESGAPVASVAVARIDAPDLCARFTARVISDLAVGPSPAWMTARLRAVGLRPISNVVDVTNYVLWELGHPLHAFDADTLADRTIVVRRARAGERLRTLDGEARTLAETMLVIADSGRAVAVAGVMGGAESEVSASTTRVLLESAYFDPPSIRRTSRALGLRTDAAYRFERGADIEMLVDASARAAQLIAELTGGRVARGLIDVYPAPVPRRRVHLRHERVQRVLGVAPPPAETERILHALHLEAIPRNGALDVEVPSFRRDIAIEDDLVEEIVRVWGYDRIPTAAPAGSIRLVTQPATVGQAHAVRRALTGAGLTEVITYSFGDPRVTEGFVDPGTTLSLLNPLSREASVMRRHPLEGVLGAVATNLRRQQSAVAIFEVGKTYERAGDGVREPRWLSVALAGMRHQPSWWRPPEAVDLYDAKGIAEHVLDALSVRGWRLAETERIGFEADRTGVFRAGEVDVAWFGEVSRDLRRRFDIEAPVFAAIVPLDAVAALPSPPTVRHEPLPRFPSVQRDMAFLVGEDQALRAGDIEAAIVAEAGPLLRQILLFDVFRFEDGKRSLAWRLLFQAADRTLTDDEVNAIHAQVARRVSDRFHISLRGV